MILLDTAVLIDAGRGVEPAKRVLREALDRRDVLAASVLTKVELLRNVRSGERSVLRALFEQLSMVAVTEQIADLAGDLARRYRRSHQGVDVVDFVIAATATSLDAQLWTRNLKHFPMFPGLAAPY